MHPRCIPVIIARPSRGTPHMRRTRFGLDYSTISGPTTPNWVRLPSDHTFQITPAQASCTKGCSQGFEHRPFLRLLAQVGPALQSRKYLQGPVGAWNPTLGRHSDCLLISATAPRGIFTSLTDGLHQGLHHNTHPLETQSGPMIENAMTSIGLRPPHPPKPSSKRTAQPQTPQKTWRRFEILPNLPRRKTS
jgi:hypothetical protein